MCTTPALFTDKIYCRQYGNIYGGYIQPFQPSITDIVGFQFSIWRLTMVLNCHNKNIFISNNYLILSAAAFLITDTFSIRLQEPWCLRLPNCLATMLTCNGSSIADSSLETESAAKRMHILASGERCPCQWNINACHIFSLQQACISSEKFQNDLTF